MPQGDVKSQGKELLSWEISEYHAHERGTLWIIGALVVGIALLIWAVSTRNFLFAFILIMFGVIIATHSLRPPTRYQFAVSEKGVRLGERFYPWRDIAKFWIVWEPPAVKTIYFEFSGLRPRLPIPLGEIDPEQLREILAAHLAEDISQNEEPFSDWIARVLKI